MKNKSLAGVPAISAEEAEVLKGHWQSLMAHIMWKDVQSDQIGKLSRTSKRLLDLGESLRSYISAKDWINQPRQQLKSALGSSIKVRDSFESFKSNAELLNRGNDIDQFKSMMKQFESELFDILTLYENQWAEQLEALNNDE